MPTPPLWGSNFQVNTGLTTFDQISPHVSNLADGRTILTWATQTSGSLSTIRHEILNADGTVSVAETTLNTGQSGTGVLGFNQSSTDYLAVAGLTNGNYVVTWSYDNDTTPDENIWYQIFDANGTALTGALSEAIAGRQNDPDVVALANGQFAIAWDSDDGANGGVWQQYYNELGEHEGVRLFVSESTGGVDPALAGYGAFAFAVFRDDSAPGLPNILYDYSGQGTSTFGVDWNRDWNGAGNINRQADIAINGAVQYAVVFSDYGVGGVHEWNVFAGFNGGATIRVNTTSISAAADPSVVATTEGNFLVIWHDGNSASYGAGFDILGQLFSGSGVAIGGEFVITDPGITYNGISSLEASITLDGRVLVTWSGGTGTSAGQEIFAQYVDPRQAAANWNGGALGEQFVGTAFGDTLAGNGGNDFLNGAGGYDTALYDQAVVGVNVQLHTNLVDAVAAGHGFDTLLSIENAIGGAGGDQCWGSNADNIFYGNNGNDWLHGFVGSDYLFGGNDSDQLLGGDGIDYLYGQGGNDYFWFDELDAVISGGEGTDYAYLVTVNGCSVNLFTSSLDGVWAGNGNDILNADGMTTYAYLIGYAGADTITGGSAGDYIWVDYGAGDIIDGNGGRDEMYHIGTAGISVNLATSELEVVVGAGGVDVLNGSTVATYVQLYGRGGNDVLTGSAFGDYLYGDSENDTLRGNDGNDYINGGTGTNDRAQYAGVVANYTVTALGGGVYTVAGFGFTDTLAGVEFLDFDGGGSMAL